MDNVGQERSGAEEELRQLVLERVEAVRAKDPDPLDASQAEDVVTFEVIPPLVSHGKDMGREATRQWFDSYDGPIGSGLGLAHQDLIGHLGNGLIVAHCALPFLAETFHPG